MANFFGIFLPRNDIFSRSWQNFRLFFCHEMVFLVVSGRIKGHDAFLVAALFSIDALIVTGVPCPKC